MPANQGSTVSSADICIQDMGQPRLDPAQYAHFLFGLQHLANESCERSRAHAMKQSATVNVMRQPLATDLGPMPGQYGQSHSGHHQRAPPCSLTFGGDVVSVGVAAAPKLLPISLDLGTIQDVRAALYALQDVEQFLERAGKQLEPSHSCISGQWRRILDRLMSRMSEQKRRLKETIYEDPLG